jgi:predicted DNA-binding protein YlxM (UPF0122 family)
MAAVKTKEKPGACTLPLSEIADLRAKGLSMEKIARLGGVSKQAISQLIRRNGIDPVDIGQFKKDKSLILHSKQRILLDRINQETVKSMSVRDASVSFGIVFDKTRLTDGEPTANVAYTKIDLSVYQTSPVAPYQATQLCSSCNTYVAVADAGLCELCRKDATARAAEPKALPVPATEGGANDATR